MQNLDFPAQQSCCIRRFEGTDRLKISPSLKPDVGTSSGLQAYGYSFLLALGLGKICKSASLPQAGSLTPHHFPAAWPVESLWKSWRWLRAGEFPGGLQLFSSPAWSLPEPKTGDWKRNWLYSAFSPPNRGQRSGVSCRGRFWVRHKH